MCTSPHPPLLALQRLNRELPLLLCPTGVDLTVPRIMCRPRLLHCQRFVLVCVFLRLIEVHPGAVTSNSSSR